MPNPNLFKRIYDAQQRILEESVYLTLFVGSIFVVTTGLTKQVVKHSLVVSHVSCPFCRVARVMLLP